MLQTKVMVVSGNERLYRALAHVLDRDEQLDFCGGSRTAEEALALVEAEQPDLVISAQPPTDLTEVYDWRRIYDQGPRLLMLTNYLHDGDAIRSLLAGASGFVLTSAGGSRWLMDAALRVAQGESLISKDLIGRLRDLATNEELSQLDAREREVLGLILDGETDHEIALETESSAQQVHYRIERLVDQLS